MVRLAWAGWWLGLLPGILLPAIAVGQTRNPPPAVELRENVPNPVVTTTTISFRIDPEVCARGHRPTVSLRIYNVLVQVVAVPVLLDANGERLENLRLGCREYRAYWDGKLLDGERDATSGVYYYQLTVDGERYTRKMILQRRVTSSRSTERQGDP